jgi:hypothetical protein
MGRKYGSGIRKYINVEKTNLSPRTYEGPGNGNNCTLRVVSYILFLMQREEQHRTLSRRRRYLMINMALQNDDDNFENMIVVLSELPTP